MKKQIALLALLAALLLLSGCGPRIDYSLPENPTEFVMEEFVNSADPEDGYMTFTYNGRTYVPYGCPKGRITGNDVGACLGFCVQDGVKDKDTRILLLNEDREANYLIQIHVNGIMDQPVFFRAADTVGKEISTPGCIESLDYDFWK